MRSLLFAALVACSASAALAQDTLPPQRAPTTPPPSANATFEQRDAWCQDYAAWFVNRMPASEAPPEDARPTRRIETELDYCRLDPDRYRRETLAELTGTTRGVFS